MNAHQMATQTYAAQAPVQHTGRAGEYKAFATVTERISSFRRDPGDYRALVTALSDNNRLWTRMAAGVADKDNPLPAQLKAQILYLAEFMQAHTRKVLRGTDSVDAILDINIAMMRGLRAEGETP